MSLISGYIRHSQQNRYPILWTAIILERLATLGWYNLRFSDSDQTILWTMAQDILQGSFHGLCFYGQSYNVALEAFLAVPLLALGLSYPLAFAVITHGLTLLSFGLLSDALKTRINPNVGLIPLLILLLLPPEYLLISSLSRGFVTGIALMILAFWFWCQPFRSTSLFLTGFLIPTAIFCNPNSLLLIPVFLFRFPDCKLPVFRIILYSGLGLVAGCVLPWWNQVYYQNHPGMAFHPAPNLNWDFSYFTIVAGQLDNYFTFITPVIWRSGWLSLLILFAIPVILWKKQVYLIAFISFSFLAGILGSFFLEKTTDATNSVYFSGSRMFMAIPLIWATMAGFWPESDKKQYWTGIAFHVALVATLIKIIGLPFFIRAAHGGSKNAIVHVFKHKDLNYQCHLFRALAKSTHSTIIYGLDGDTGNQPLAYACPCLLKDFPKTGLGVYERRTWLPLPDFARENVLLFGCNKEKWVKANLTPVWLNQHYPAYGLRLLQPGKMPGLPNFH